MALGTFTFHGKVTSGEGNGRKFLQLPWVIRQLEEKLGYTPYFGTLNLALSAESARQKKFLARAGALQICPAEGYCAGLVFPASISGLECSIVLPQVEGYSERLLELVAPVYLRGTLNLKDGDEVSVTVSV
jgi:riboflavin kinase, archaea type